MTSKASRFGDYIDALADRYRESIFYFGFALAGYPFEALLALSGSLLVSFAKARTAMCVPIDDHDWPAIGDMADRNIVLIIGLVGAGIKPIWFSKYNFLSFVLLSIGLFTHIGCVCRIFYAKKIIETEERNG
jgi:phosphatidylglycerophosphate synthase